MSINEACFHKLQINPYAVLGHPCASYHLARLPSSLTPLHRKLEPERRGRTQRRWLVVQADANPMAQNSSEALYNMVFGPKNLKI